MKKTELDHRIFELLKKKLGGKVSEYTIRPAITRIRRKNPSLTLNAAAEIFAKKHGESVQKFFNERDREAFGTIKIEKVNISVSQQKRKVKKLKGDLAKMEKSDPKWDVFICHASEDKESIADPLYEALNKAGLKVWYDKSTLKLGDRLHKSIDIGIAKSGYGIVILSQSFFKKDWPQRELEALAAKELEGQKVILPIWHNVDAAFVRSKSLLLSGLVAISTIEGVGNIVNKVLEVVKPNNGKSSGFSVPTAILTLPKSKESTRSILEGTIRSLQAIDKPTIAQTIKQMDFDVLKRTYLDVLDGVSFLKIAGSSENENIFCFIREAILERDRTEGAELFEMLFKWYFETTTPYCRNEILQIFATLTTLRHLKEVAVKENRTSDFVAEFGRSDSYAIAAINAEILQNIKTSLSENDCKRIVDFSLANDQIYCSYNAKMYLVKLLPTCETRVDKGKLDQLYGLIR
jgi:transcriptional regulator